MKVLNNKKLLRTLVAFVLLNFYCNIVCAQNYGEDIKIRTMLHSFYTTYISAGCEDLSTNYEPKLNRILKRYCTAKFVKNLTARTETGEIDWDPLINAQDFDPKWILTLSIKRNISRINQYDISYFDDYSQKECTMKVTVTKQGEDFLINNVLLYDSKWLFN